MKERFEDTLTVKVPAKLSELVETAAHRQFTSTSTYVRQSLARALKSDGFDLDALT